MLNHQSCAPEPRQAIADTSQLVDEFLVFQLGGEEYALDILWVQEIRASEAMTRLADAPAYFAGVINLRGLIVPMLDLRIKFGFTPDTALEPVAIILNTGETQIGILVDGVSEVISSARAAIKAPPDLAEIGTSAMIQGILSLEQRMLIVLDFAKFIISIQSTMPQSALDELH